MKHQDKRGHRKIGHFLHAVQISLLLFVLFLSIYSFLYRPVWCDEGWNLTVARNWVQLGHYGRLLLGRSIGIGLANRPPVIASTALGFRLFGIGLWQGRLLSLLFTIGTIILLYALASKLWDRTSALLALALLAFSIAPDANFLLLGPRAMGESLMLFLSVAGFLALVSFTKNNFLCFIIAFLIWSAALTVKPQLFPFFVASFTFPLVLSLLCRYYSLALRYALILGVAIVLSRFLIDCYWFLIDPRFGAPTPLSGTYQIQALVTDFAVRTKTFAFLAQVGLPLVLSLTTEALLLLRDISHIKTEHSQQIYFARLSLWTFAVTWVTWYGLLSVGWPRYLTPALVVGIIFSGHILVRSLAVIAEPISAPIGTRKWFRFRCRPASLLSILYCGLILYSSILTTRGYIKELPQYSTSETIDTAKFIEDNVKSTEVIETYESELFFLLTRSYHYPPDQLSVDLNRAAFLKHGVTVDYDPLSSNPEYLVVGIMGRIWHLYDDVVKDGHFRFLRRIGPYEIFKRVRKEGPSDF